MSTTYTDMESRRQARAERLARIRDKGVPAFGPVEDIAIADLAVGDFLVMVPTQSGVRGAAVESLITDLRHSWDTWGQRTPGVRRRYPVPSTVLTFGSRGADDWRDQLDVPDTFRCRVRRPAR